MGKISDAIERHDNEDTYKLSDLKPAIPKRLVPEGHVESLAKEPFLKREVSSKLVTLSEADSAYAECFKVLRGQILFPRDRKVPRSILVTSVFPGEGKSYVAANLATSLALGIDEHVMLIDADLHRPSLHRLFGQGNGQGLHEYLVGGLSLDSLVRQCRIEKLSLLPAGRTARNATELLSSNMMSKFLEEVEERFKNWFLIIDSPPCHIKAETKSMGQRVDGIILVVMAGKTPRKQVEKAIESFDKEKLLGIVFNGHDKALRNYYQYYDHYSRRD